MTVRASSQPEMQGIRETAPPETALLKIEQVAAWFQCGVRTVEDMALPIIEISPHNRRYSVRQILDHLERRAAA